MDYMEKILCYYHGVDNDGFFSGALVKYFMQIISPQCEVELKPWTYSREVPKLEKLLGYDKLFLVDLHWTNELQYKLWESYGRNFIWIDHHKSSIDEFYEWLDKNNLYQEDGSFGKKLIQIEGLQSCEYAACRNTWKYFTYLLFGQYYKCPMLSKLMDLDYVQPIPEVLGLSNIDKKIPLWLYFVSTYDAWKRSEDKEFWDKYLMPFETSMRNLIRSAEDAYKYLTDYIKYVENYGDTEYNFNFVKAQIKEGKLLLDYQQKNDDRDAKVAGWSKNIVADDGTEYKAYLLNTQRRGSAIFKSIPNLESYDLLIPFYMDKDKWNYSAYSFKEDIYIPGIYIKGVKFNGHPKAAGCQSKEFLFS